MMRIFAESRRTHARPAWNPVRAAVRQPGAAPHAAGSRAGGSGFGHEFSGVPVRARGVPALQAKLAVNAPGDAHEQVADRTAAQVMRMPAPDGGHKCSCGGRCPTCRRNAMLQAMHAPRAAAAPSTAPPAVGDALRAPGQALDPATRSFMEPRFGHDFAHVRVHTGAQAARSAGAIGARAYTVGRDVVFGAGEYAPSSGEGRRLLAHELTHVVQQSGGAPGAPPDRVVQRAPTIRIRDRSAIGPAAADERTAAVSTPIRCCDHPLGTLHAMPLFSTANGVGSALHFIAGGAAPPAGDRCHCDDHHIIQIIQTSHPLGGRNGAGFVDNGGASTPFYQDIGLSGRGEHEIPAPPAGYDPFPDQGERVQTTESIYDQPWRGPAGTRSISWMAESCVACEKNNAPDRILGCVTYGFTRNYNTTTSAFDAVVPVAPGSRAAPTTHFLDTLRTDPTTSSYSFEGPPGFLECSEAGDYPIRPPGDTRYA